MNRIPFFENRLPVTPVVRCRQQVAGCEIHIKRDDMLPFSFGGNKVRKAAEFYREILREKPDVVMTYGSSSSNHCRIIANMAHAMGLACHIISPEEAAVPGKDAGDAADSGGRGGADGTHAAVSGGGNGNGGYAAEQGAREIPCNAHLVRAFGATVETVPVTQVAQTIEARKAAFAQEGKKPYFIMGGGHGNPGTEAYVRAYGEILRQEQAMGLRYDLIFHASGTGATQAGLISGELLEREDMRMLFEGGAGAGTGKDSGTEPGLQPETKAGLCPEIGETGAGAHPETGETGAGAGTHPEIAVPEAETGGRPDAGAAGIRSRIVGISIARDAVRGGDAVWESVMSYLRASAEALTSGEPAVFDMSGEASAQTAAVRRAQYDAALRAADRTRDLVFTDAYICGGYGKYDESVAEVLRRMMAEEGIPMDGTYVGKAFAGMCRYLEENEISGKRILFIHTGGTPLFFDALQTLI